MSRLLLVLLSHLSVAALAADVTLTLDQIPARVIQHHPDLTAARLQIAEARARTLGAGRLQNPTASIDWRSESRLSPSEGAFSLEQSFPLTRRLSLEKMLTTQLITSAELEVKNAERKAVAAAQEIAIQILAIRSQRSLRQQQVALADQLADFANARAKAGELSSLDASQTQLDAKRLQFEVKRIDAEAIRLIGSLKPMLKVAANQSLEIKGELPKPSQISEKSGAKSRSDYALAQHRITTAATNLEIAKARRWQDPSIGIVGGPEQQTTADAGRQRTGFIGLRFSIPLPIWNRNQGELAEQNVQAERARLEAENLASQIQSETETARKEMQAFAALARETRSELLPMAKQQVSQLQAAFEKGQSDLATLLRASDQHLQLESAALDAERDFHLARIRLEAATGIHTPVTP